MQILSLPTSSPGKPFGFGDLAMARVQLELFHFPSQAVPKPPRAPRKKRAARDSSEQLDIIDYLNRQFIMNSTLVRSPLLPYQGNPPFVATSETSREAASSVKETAGAIRSKVYRHFLAQGVFGATCDEVEVALELRHQTASARCRELVLQGLLEKRQDGTGKPVRRPTRSGRAADVLFAATPFL
jgi:hypothetical protein